MEDIKYKWSDFLIRYITANHHINESIYDELEGLTMKYLDKENNDFFHWFWRDGIINYIHFLEQEEISEETKRSITLEEDLEKTLLFFELEIGRAYELD